MKTKTIQQTPKDLRAGDRLPYFGQRQVIRTRDMGDDWLIYFQDGEVRAIGSDMLVTVVRTEA